MILLTVFSCNSAHRNEIDHEHEMADTQRMAHGNKAKNLFKDIAFDDKYDLSCGMPLTAGLTDTAHYNGKVYGFCSPECKEDFQKNPKKLLSAKKSK